MPSSDYTPSVAEVALFLRTRTRDTNGNELGTFTSATRPTDTQAAALIADTVVDVEDDIGVDIDPRLWSSAKRITALRTAMAIEVSYFSEQVAAGRSVYPQLKEWYQEDLDKLNVAIVETAEGGDPGTDAGENTPSWGGGDYPFIPGLDLNPSGVDLRARSTWPEALGAFHEAVDLHEAATAAVLGTTTDSSVASPSGGTIASYLRKIRDLLTGTLNVNVVSTASGAGTLTNTELRASPVPVSGPLTDAQIRATPVPVSSPALTDAQLRATRVPVDPGAGPFPVSVTALPLPTGSATEATLGGLATATGQPGDTAWASGNGTVIALLKKIASSGAALGLTNTELRATPIDVNIASGEATGLTDTQLRATAVPVSGPLTDAQLRASAVPISVASLPLPSGAATETTLSSLLTGVGAPGDTAATTTGSVIAQARRIANLLAGTLTISGTVAVSGTVPVSGPVTDTQLRASAVPVSLASVPLPTGAATETTVAAANTALGTTADAASSTTGTVIAHLRKIRDLLNGTLAVSGPLTDTQLRASAVPVSIAASVAVTGPLTDAQLRATAVPVSATFWQATQPVSLASLPLPTGASTETTLASVLTGVGAPADAAATTTGSVIAQLRRIANLLAATLTVSGTVSVSGSVAVTGTFWQTTQPVSGTFWQATQPISAASLPLPTGAALDATLSGGTLQAINRGGAKGVTTAATVTSTASGVDHQGLDIILYDASGNRLGTSTTPVRVDTTGTTVQPVSAASLPLPTGAATETSVALAATALGAPGDAAATTTGSVVAQLRRIANLLAGTIAVSGTFWQATQPVSAASLPLPTGASTETTLASLLTTAGATGDAAATGTGSMNAHLRSIAAALAGTLTVTGGGGGIQYVEDVASVGGETMTLAGAIRQDTPASSTSLDGDYANLKTDSVGRLWVNSSGVTQPVSGTFWQVTQPVSAASLPLPTGAATETSVALSATALGAPADAAATTTGSVIAQLRRIANLLAGSIAVTGTFWQATQPVSAASLPLPTGASTETTLASLLTSIGATADAASSTTGTLNAHLRSIAAALTGNIAVTGTFWQATQPISAASLPLPTGASTAAKQPALGTTAAPSADVLSIIQPDLTATGTISATGTPASITTLNGHSSVAVQITALTTATVTFEGTVDGSTWFGLNGQAVSGTGALVGTATATGAWQFDVGGLAGFRARVSAWTSGAVTVFIRATRGDSAAAIDLPLPAGSNVIGGVTGSGNFATTSAAASQADGHSAAIGSTTDAAATTTGSVIAQLRRIANLLAGTLTLTANQSVNVAQINGVTPLMGNGVTGTGSQRVTIASDNTAFAVLPQAGTSGGWSVSKLISGASTNATSLKGSAGQIGGWYIFNANAATRYVKLYNKASAPTVGTDVPVWVIPVPAGGAANVEFANGLAFATGIAYATTTGILDTDSAAVAANDLVINWAYK